MPDDLNSKNYINKSLETNFNYNDKQSKRLRVLIYILTICAVIMQIIVDGSFIISGSGFGDPIIWGLVIIISINSIVLYFTQNLQRASSVLLISFFAGILMVLYSDPTTATGNITYIPLVPILIFFIKKKKEAAVLSLIFFITMMGVVILQLLEIYSTPYNVLGVVQSIFAMSMTGLLCYFYQDISEKERTTSLLESIKYLKHEVVERTEAEKKVAEDKAKDEALLSSIGDGMIATDLDGKVELTNANTKEILGIEFENIKGKALCDELIFFDAKQNLLSKDQQPVCVALNTQKKVSGEYIFVKPDKTKIALDIVAAPVSQDGKVIGVIMTFRDMTEIKDVERTKTEFVSIASHQMRTPLTSSNWYIELLLDKDNNKLSPEDEKMYLVEIKKANERLVKLTDAVLYISRLELGTFYVKPQNLKLYDLYLEVVESTKSLQEEKKISIKENIDKELTLSVDPDWMKLFFDTLMTNAMKYSPEGNGIEINLFVADDKFANKNLKDSIILQVKDTGYGIPAGEQTQIFSKFYRGKNIMDKDTYGNGLGLYVAKLVADVVGAKIWFESEESKGSTFYIAIPKTGMKEVMEEKR
jgi:PAS domain S-box-containing protein